MNKFSSKFEIFMAWIYIIWGYSLNRYEFDDIDDKKSPNLWLKLINEFIYLRLINH